ncbi:hypothetical protein AAG570_003518 [Ranatra chinensis]|uniref:Uncharacterized protein n=1 Tax=Ranatra chinensis TaxID=642074 RepID=A0ABD0YGF8_9HEMI
MMGRRALKKEKASSRRFERLLAKQNRQGTLEEVHRQLVPPIGRETEVENRAGLAATLHEEPEDDSSAEARLYYSAPHGFLFLGGSGTSYVLDTVIRIVDHSLCASLLTYIFYFYLECCSSRPLYLRYQTGQNEGAPRAIGGYTADQGFPQLSSSYNGHNQYQQSVQGRRGDGQQSSVVLLNSSWAGGGAPLRSVGRHQAQPPPPHVSFNAGSSHQQPPPLPPIINWRNSSTPSLQQLQVDVGPRLLPHEEHRQGRWSRRQDNDNSRNRLL